MPVTSVIKDPEDLTMTVTADFDASVQRLWDAYMDPRVIERFWGPPAFPATFTRHDGRVGGRSNFTMNGPDDAVSRGYWDWLAVEPQQSFEVRDGFANADGTPDTSSPSMRMVFHFEPTKTGSRVTITTHFDSLEELDHLLSMGMDEGMREAMGQIDGVLAELQGVTDR